MMDKLFDIGCYDFSRDEGTCDKCGAEGIALEVWDDTGDYGMYVIFTICANCLRDIARMVDGDEAKGEGGNE